MAKGYRIWQGIQNVAAPLPYFVSPHTLWEIHYLALHRTLTQKRFVRSNSNLTGT